jgi:2-polyprenyl-3-methyl-5-hydroxy-6-metoxy-1,4-benzoquinol methylase
LQGFLFAIYFNLQSMDLSTIQHIDCPSCNQNSFTKQHIVKQWQIVQCTNCNFVYTNPRLTNEAIKNLYELNYFNNSQYGYTNYNDNPHLKQNNFAKWILESLPYMPSNIKPKALDIGCAAGFAFPVFEKNKIIVDGVELDSNYVQQLRSKGYTIYDKPLLQNKFDEQYDIVTLFDVVEHLINLDEHFKFLNKLITPSGIMVVVTPDYASTQRKVFGKRWFQFKPMEHINYFTIDSLTTIAKRNGFELLIYKKSGQYADANFIIARLKKYNFPLVKILLIPIIAVLRMLKKSIYLDAASFYAIYRKKKNVTQL